MFCGGPNVRRRVVPPPLTHSAMAMVKRMASIRQPAEWPQPARFVHAPRGPRHNVRPSIDSRRRRQKPGDSPFPFSAGHRDTHDDDQIPVPSAVLQDKERRAIEW
jgi:hypothetical protein